MIVFDTKTFPNVKLDEVRAAYDEALARFEKNGIDPKDLERYKVQEETRTYNRLTSTNGKALSMARDNVFGGTPDRTLKDLERYRAVTPEDVMRVYEKYIKGKNLLSISIFPQNGQELALSGATQVFSDQESIEEQELNSESGKVVDDPYEKTPSAFDRSIERDCCPILRR